MRKMRCFVRLVFVVCAVQLVSSLRTEGETKNHEKRKIPGEHYRVNGFKPKPHLESITITKEVHIPYPVKVEKKVPVPVKVRVEKPYPVYITKHYPVPVEERIPYPVKVPVPQPYPVEKKIHIPFKVPVEKPVPYPVEKPVPVYLEKQVHYPVEKEVPVPVKIPVERPVPYPVRVEKPIPYPVQKKVRVPIKIPVDNPIPVAVDKFVYYPVQNSKYKSKPSQKPRIVPSHIPVNPMEDVLSYADEEVKVEIQNPRSQFNAPHLWGFMIQNGTSSQTQSTTQPPARTVTQPNQLFHLYNNLKQQEPATFPDPPTFTFTEEELSAFGSRSPLDSGLSGKPDTSELSTSHIDVSKYSDGKTVSFVSDIEHTKQ